MVATFAASETRVKHIQFWAKPVVYVMHGEEALDESPDDNT